MVGQAYHVDELGDGQPEAHDDHVRGVGHWPCPAVVAPEEVFEEAILGLGVVGSPRQHWRTGRKSGVSGSPGWWVFNSLSQQSHSNSLSLSSLICKVGALSRTYLITLVRSKQNSVCENLTKQPACGRSSGNIHCPGTTR